MKKAILGALFAGAMLASCSSDEPLVNGGEDNNKGDLGYVSVNIVQPASAGTRAGGDQKDGFEYGYEAENEAKTGMFYIFKDGGASFQDAQTVVLSGKGENGANIERMYNAVLVIDGAKDKPTAAKYIVCVLNAPSGLTGKESLADLEKKIGDYSTHAAGSFIMTNSVYQSSDSKKVLGAAIEETNIKESAAAAKESAPVNIYVERVVAKIRAKKDEGFSNTGTGEIEMGATKKSFNIKITGIEVANIAKSAYLFKELPTTAPTWDWNDASKYRCYWEHTVDTTSYKNQSYAQIAPSSFDWDNFTKMDSVYVQPNINGTDTTAVLVTAQLVETQKDKDGNDVPADLVYIQGGYTTMAGATAIVAEHIANKGYWKRANDYSETNKHYEQLSKDDFEWYNKNDSTALTWLKSYEVIPQIKSTVKLYIKGDETYTEATEKQTTSINALLGGTNDKRSAYTARIFKDGKCYYFVNIENSIAGVPGVVRNHIYELSLKGIGGIGVPVFDPDDVIIPENPEDEDLYYLAAKINVLSWKLVTQNVTFQGH